MKAIETVYKGIRFRSRLEARWAVFFDAAGIEWKYEHEGYKQTYGDGDVCYLPDFYLPGTVTFAEVKGCDEALRNDRDKLRAILDWNSPLPNIHGSLGTNHGLLLLGDIPDVTGGHAPLHPIIQHNQGLWRAWSTFDDTGAFVLADGYGERPTVGWMYDTLIKVDSDAVWSLTPKILPGAGLHKTLWNAYREARQARFEHGESPRLAGGFR